MISAVEDSNMSLDETPHAGSRRKLDELFVHWLSLPDTQQALRALVEDVRAGREVDLTSTRSSASFAGAATGRGSRAKLPVSPSRAAASHFSYDFVAAGRDSALWSGEADVSTGFTAGGTPTRTSLLARMQQHDAAAAAAAADSDSTFVSSPSSGTAVPGGDMRAARSPVSTHSAPAGSPAGDSPVRLADGTKPPLSPTHAAERRRPQSLHTAAQQQQQQQQQQHVSTPSPTRSGAGAPRAAAASPPHTIPRFFFPKGRRSSSAPVPEDLQLQAKQGVIDEQFAKFPHGIPDMGFGEVAMHACGFPGFICRTLFNRVRQVTGSTAQASVSLGEGPPQLQPVVAKQDFLRYWQLEVEGLDEVDRLVRLLRRPGADVIYPEDFVPLLHDLLVFHPGLEFLEGSPEFQDKYARTVIVRIFYSLDRRRVGYLTERDIRRSNLLAALKEAATAENINTVMPYFSYEHFYVIYCKFWELDDDRDFRLRREDLVRFSDHSLSRSAVERVFACLPRAPRPGVGESKEERAAWECGAMQRRQLATPGAHGDGGPGQAGGAATARGAGPAMGSVREVLTYEDFVYFLLSEEDKTSPQSLEFWFACADADGDGCVRSHEMRAFYAEQFMRLQSVGHEAVQYGDVMCQMFDLLQPKDPLALTLADFLKPDRIKLVGVFFDVLFNLNKFLAYEQRDPFALMRQMKLEPHLTPWDRYARLEYVRLALVDDTAESSLGMGAAGANHGLDADTVMLGSADDLDGIGGVDAWDDNEGVLH